jgi:valyl-tRNA synthetase
LDKWILSKSERLAQKVTDAFEKCQFNIALEEVRNFTWHTFCDSYLEAVKDRLYNPDVYGDEKKAAAQYTLHKVLERILKLLAPITPHLTEEIYQTLYGDEKHFKSIHISNWPETDEKLIDEKAERQGDIVIAVITEVRREKSEKHLPLNTKISTLKIYSAEPETAKMIEQGREDIAGTCKAAEIQILSEKGNGRQIEPYGISFIAEYSQ